MATLALNRNGIAKRRSRRIALNAPVGLCGEDLQKSAFTLSATATNLNKHGAAVQIDRELRVGATLVVNNLRGNKASARVVAQVGAAQGLRTYGIEFVELNDDSQNFWGITFPSLA